MVACVLGRLECSLSLCVQNLSLRFYILLAARIPQNNQKRSVQALSMS